MLRNRASATPIASERLSGRNQLIRPAESAITTIKPAIVNRLRRRTVNISGGGIGSSRPETKLGGPARRSDLRRYQKPSRWCRVRCGARPDVIKFYIL